MTDFKVMFIFFSNSFMLSYFFIFFLDEGDMIFSLEEDQFENGTVSSKMSSINCNQNGQITAHSSVVTLSSNANKPAQPHSPLRPSRRSTHVCYVYCFLFIN